MMLFARSSEENVKHSHFVVVNGLQYKPIADILCMLKMSIDLSMEVFYEQN